MREERNAKRSAAPALPGIATGAQAPAGRRSITPPGQIRVNPDASVATETSVPKPPWERPNVSRTSKARSAMNQV